MQKPTDPRQPEKAPCPRHAITGLHSNARCDSGLLPFQQKLAPGETFRFHCHPGVPCFTQCCRELDLALTPYDVLRLRAHLGLNTDAFLDRYALLEQEEGMAFPQVFLAMEEDGQQSCPFVSPQGCRVYENRPGACRTYPLGRGAIRTAEGCCRQIHVLLREPHCQGFAASELQDVATWNKNQDLALHNAMNDEVTAILQHDQVRKGFMPSPEQLAAFLLALYQMDTFRERLLDNTLAPAAGLDEAQLRQLATDDIALLRAGIGWLRHVLFGE